MTDSFCFPSLLTLIRIYSYLERQIEMNTLLQESIKQVEKTTY